VLASSRWVTAESAIALLAADAWSLAGIGNPALGLPVRSGSAAAGLLLILGCASGLWALAGLLEPGIGSLRPASRLLGAAFVVLVASVVSDQMPGLTAVQVAFAAVAIAGTAALPVAAPRAMIRLRETVSTTTTDRSNPGSRSGRS